MPRSKPPLPLFAEQRNQLLQWVSAQGTPQQVALRCRIVLAAADGQSDPGIATDLKVSRPTVILWRVRFAAHGLESLWRIAPGRGRKPTLGNWMFASPAQIGWLPWPHDAVGDAYLKAAKCAGIGHVSTHTMRHTYRSWLDAVGTPVAVQQKLMRHADIRTTMNIYGDVVTDEMQQAHSKVVGLALNRAQAERKAS